MQLRDDPTKVSDLALQCSDLTLMRFEDLPRAWLSPSGALSFIPQHRSPVGLRPLCFCHF
jgi:hypothetical protein